uniref:Reelin domain-containing protein n=1 Tax=Romanomermis culicivorax TaxID=13658 RepID=A0A915KRS2_ROMCU
MNTVLYYRSTLFLRSSLALLSLLIVQLRAFQGGVPCEVLNTMQPPKSSGSAQQSRSPYGIRVTNENSRSVTEFSDGRVYTVEIYGRCGTWTPIEGFLLVSRDKNTREIIGEFLKDDSNYWQASHYPCRDVKLGSVTHYIAYKRLYPVKFHWRLNSYIAERRLGMSNNVEFEVTGKQLFLRRQDGRGLQIDGEKCIV